MANDKERRILEGSFTYEKAVNEIMSFQYGNEALEAYSNYKPDVTILDMILPGMDGLSVLEEINKKPYKSKTIIISSTKSDNVISRAFNFGADYVMVKPYDINALKRRIFDMQNPAEVTNAELENAIDENYIEKQISAILNGTGIFPNLKGYRYLKCAILYGYKDEE